jgi:hypothetical protein
VPVALLFLATILLLLVWRTVMLRRATHTARRRYRFVAPDDDPDFLRELHRRTRQVDDEQS